MNSVNMAVTMIYSVVLVRSLSSFARSLPAAMNGAPKVSGID